LVLWASIAVAFTGVAAKKSMKFSAETFALFTGDKESQMDRLMKTQFRGKRNRIGILGGD